MTPINNSHLSNPRVVYQGEPGAYSEMAARKFFGENVNTTGLYQFEDNFIALKNGTADYAVLPVENSTTGAIRQVYDLMMQYECYVVGETSVPIAHCLLGLPGATIEGIHSVYSHEQGLFQCEHYLSQYPNWERIPSADTAGSAKMIKELGDIHKAAICSSRAAEIYGLQILAPAIQTNKTNTTRFMVVAPQKEICLGANKIFLRFSANQQFGVLSDVLSLLAGHGFILYHLETRPIPGKAWEYMYFLELTGDFNAADMEDALKSVEKITRDFHLFGNFIRNV